MAMSATHGKPREMIHRDLLDLAQTMRTIAFEASQRKEEEHRRQLAKEPSSMVVWASENTRQATWEQAARWVQSIADEL